jgi:hypothetical protein
MSSDISLVHVESNIVRADQAKGSGLVVVPRMDLDDILVGGLGAGLSGFLARRRVICVVCGARSTGRHVGCSIRRAKMGGNGERDDDALN